MACTYSTVDRQMPRCRSLIGFPIRGAPDLERKECGYSYRLGLDARISKQHPKPQKHCTVDVHCTEYVHAKIKISFPNCWFCCSALRTRLAAQQR